MLFTYLELISKIQTTDLCENKSLGRQQGNNSTDKQRECINIGDTFII